MTNLYNSRNTSLNKEPAIPKAFGPVAATVRLFETEAIARQTAPHLLPFDSPSSDPGQAAQDDNEHKTFRENYATMRRPSLATARLLQAETRISKSTARKSSTKAKQYPAIQKTRH